MIGQTLGNFKIIDRLGRGAMGEVYLAEQQNVQTRAAIKLLRPELSEDRQQVQRFFNEAVAVSRIKHAGIVKIFDVGFHTNGQAYLLMELLEGETLATRLARTPRLPLRQVQDIVRQIATILDATHAAGIVHRDLKPDNIFLVPDSELATGERVKILDFGIAKLGNATTITGTGGSLGTPAYMAPEQWKNSKGVDRRADVYALGCVTYQLCCGRPPFLADSVGEACLMHLSTPPPSARAAMADVPASLDALLLRMMAKEPEDRPLVAEILATVAALAGEPPRAGAAAPVPARRWPIVVALGSVAAVGGVIAVVVATRGTETAQAPHAAATPDAMIAVATPVDAALEPSGSADTPRTAPLDTPEALIAAEYATLQRGDLSTLFAPDAFAFGPDATSIARGNQAIADQIRGDIGVGPFTIISKFRHVGREGDLAWITDELDISRTPTAFRYATTQLATHEGGTWTVRAMHRAVLVPDRVAYELALADQLPVPSVLTDAGPPAIAGMFRAAFASREAFIAAISDRASAINVGSAPGQYIRGGARIKSTFDKILATIAIRDGVVAGALSSSAGWGAANVAFTIEKDGRAVTETFRVLAALVKESGGWKIVLVQWSNGGPIAVPPK